VPGDDVVERQLLCPLAAVLTGVVITAEDLTLGETHVRVWSVHHVFQSDNGRAGELLSDGLNEAAAIEQHLGLPGEIEADSSAGGTDV
jgi:hypothetical protein